MLNIPNATNFGNDQTGTFTSASSGAQTFNFGGVSNVGVTASNIVNVRIIAGTSAPTFTGTFNNITFSSGYTGTPATQTINCYGTLTLVSTGTFTGVSYILTGSNNIVTNGTCNIGTLFIGTTGASATWTLSNAITFASTSTVTVTNGSIVLNGYNITTGIFSINSSYSTNVTFGGNNITLTGTATVLSMANMTNWTNDQNGGFVSTAPQVQTFTVGTSGITGSSYSNLVNLTVSGSSVITFTSASIGFNTLNLNGYTGSVASSSSVGINNITLNSGAGLFANMTVNYLWGGTYTSNNKSVANLNIGGAGFPVNWYLTSNINVVTTTNLINGTLYLGDGVGGGYYISTGNFTCTTTYSSAIYFYGKNIFLTGGAGVTVLTINSTGLSLPVTGPAAGFASNMPNAQTFNCQTSGAIIFIYGGTGIPTFTTGNGYYQIDFTGYTGNPGTQTLNPTNLTLSSGGTFTGITYSTTNQYSLLDTKGKTIAALTVNISYATNLPPYSQLYSLYLNSATTVSGATTITQGVLDTQGYTLTTGSFSIGTGTSGYYLGTNNNNQSAPIILTGTGTVLSIPNVTNMYSNTFTPKELGWFSSSLPAAQTFTVGTSGVNYLTDAGVHLAITGSSTTSLPTFNGVGFYDVSFTSYTGTIPSATSVTCYILTLGTSGNYANLTYNAFWGDPAGSNASSITTNGSALGGLNIGTASKSVYFKLLYTYLFSGSIPLVVSGTTTITNGTLDLTGCQNTPGLSPLKTGIFTINGSYSANVIFGIPDNGPSYPNNIQLTGGTGVTVLNIPNMSNFTNDLLGNFISSMPNAQTFTAGTSGATTNNLVNVLINSGTGAASFTGNGFNIVNFTGYTGTAGTSTIGCLTLILTTSGTFTNVTYNLVAANTIIAADNSSIGVLNIGTSSTPYTWYLPKYYIFSTLSNVNIVNGTIVLNGFPITTGIFSITGTSPANLLFNGQNVYLTGTGTVLGLANMTNWSNDQKGSFQTAMPNAQTFNCGGTSGATSTNAVNLSLYSGTGLPTFTGTGFNTIDFTGYTGNPASAIAPVCNTLILTNSGTYANLTYTLTATNNIITNGTSTIGTLFIGNTGTSRTFTLTNNITLGSASTVNITNGTIVLNGYTITTGFFTVGGSFPAKVTFGGNNIALTGTGTVLALATMTNWSNDQTGAFTSTMPNGIQTFTAGPTGATSTNAINVSITGGSAVPTFTTGSTGFNTINFTGYTGNPGAQAITCNTLILSSSGTFTTLTYTLTGTNNIITNGTSTIGTLFIGTTGASATWRLSNSVTLGSASTVTVTNGSIVLNGYTITTGIFTTNPVYSTNVTFGGNYSINLTGTGTVLSLANTVNFTNDQLGNFASNMPLAQTFNSGGTSGASATNAVNVNINGGTLVPTFTGTGFKAIDFTGYLGTISSSSISCTGLTLGAGGTYTGLTPTFVWPYGTFTSNGKSIAALNLNIASSIAGIGLGSAATVLGATTITNGLLSLSGYTLTTSTFTVGTGTSGNLLGVNFGYQFSPSVSPGSIVLSSTTGTVLNIPNLTNYTNDYYGSFSCAMGSTARTLIVGTSGSNVGNRVQVSITSGTGVPTFTGNFGVIDFTGYTGNPGTQSINCAGLILSTGGTYTSLTANFIGTLGAFVSASPPVIGYPHFTPNGKAIAAMNITASLDSNFPIGTFPNYYPTYNLVDLNSAATVNGATTLSSGILQLKTTLTTQSFVLNNTAPTNITFAGNQIILSPVSNNTTVLSMPDLIYFSTDDYYYYLNYPGVFSGGFASAIFFDSTFTSGTINGASQGIATGMSYYGTVSSAPNLTITTGSYLKNTATISSGSSFNRFDISGFNGSGIAGSDTYVSNYKGVSGSYNGTVNALNIRMYGTTYDFANSYISGSANNIFLPNNYNSLLTTTTQLKSDFIVQPSGNLFLGAVSSLDLNGYTITANNVKSTGDRNVYEDMLRETQSPLSQYGPPLYVPDTIVVKSVSPLNVIYQPIYFYANYPYPNAQDVSEDLAADAASVEDMSIEINSNYQYIFDSVPNGPSFGNMNVANAWSTSIPIIMDNSTTVIVPGSTVIDGGGLTNFGSIFVGNPNYPTPHSVNIRNSDTFNSILANPGANIIFTTTSTPTINTLSLSGNASSNISISSDGPGTQANINLLSLGVVQYSNIKDINVLTNNVYAYNSNDLGDNSNVIFKTAITNASQFIPLF